ncbi:MAG TPA: TonB family protein, partial [Blastocatellia bacterium]|nr:TonB family protein [Blastocatellia bacterium]
MRIAHAGLEPPQATNLTLPSLLIALLAISVAAASALATPRRQENNLGSGPIELSAGALEARALRRIECQYPQLARAAHISGTVVVRVVVDEGGNPISAWAMTGHPLLTYPATVAARGWRFTPIRLAGVPVQMTGPIVFDFNLHRRTSYVGLDRDRIGLNDPVDLPLGQGLLATAKFLDDQISALAKECPRMIKSLRGGPVYRITGRVIDDQTAAPLSNATVYLSSLCPMVGTDHLYEQDHIRWQTVTGQDGTFALDGVPSMEATLSAARDGYILVWPFRRTVDAPGPKFVVMPGGVVQRYAPEDDSNPNERVETERANPGPLTLRMAHAGSVVVTVRGPDGKRLPNATVLLGMYSPGAGIRHIEPSTRYPVEPALVGVYRYDRLAPGRYYVLAACNEQYCSELSHDRNGNVIGLLPARFPRPTSRNNDPFLKLEEGQHRNVEIQLHRGRFHQVTITTSGVDAWPYSLEAVDS